MLPPLEISLLVLASILLVVLVVFLPILSVSGVLLELDICIFRELSCLVGWSLILGLFSESLCCLWTLAAEGFVLDLVVS